MFELPDFSALSVSVEAGPGLSARSVVLRQDTSGNPGPDEIQIPLEYWPLVVAAVTAEIAKLGG